MKNLLDVAKKAAGAAGKIQKEKQGHVESIEFKGDINIVTEVDRACESIIIETIKESYPDHQILAEESGMDKSTSPYKWIIDPLDGTTNYAHGYPCYCVSIALEHEGKIQIGVIYDPTREEMFEAVRGHGTSLNGHPIKVSQTEPLKRSLLVTGFAYDVRESENNNLDHFANFIFSSQAVRRDGTAALDLAYVACGRFDGFWELNLRPWDVAAGSLMVEEAGGKLSLFDGTSLDIYKKEIVASNGKIHQEMLEILERRKKGRIK